MGCEANSVWDTWIGIARERKKTELKVRKVQAGDITQLTTVFILYHATAMRQPTVYDRHLPSHLLDAVST